MQIFRQQDTGWEEGRPDHFVGQVRLQRMQPGEGQPHLRLYRVEFAAGARTNWHRHSVPQFLYVLEGRCSLGRRGASLQRLMAGDLAQIEPGLEHFHGADHSGSMVHLAITISVDAKTTWLEAVSDDDY